MSAADPAAAVDESMTEPSRSDMADVIVSTAGAPPPNSTESVASDGSTNADLPTPAAVSVDSAETSATEPAADVALGMSRGDRLFAGTLGVVILVLLLIHWARLTGWGARTVEIERQTPQTFTFRLDINSANWVELSQLDGLGEALARRIVEERDRNGPYQKIDDLRRVKGIGPKTLDKLRPWIKASVEEAPSDDESRS